LAPSVAIAGPSASYSTPQPDLLALKVVEMDSTMEVYIEAACDACMGHLPSLPPPKLGLTALSAVRSCGASYDALDGLRGAHRRSVRGRIGWLEGGHRTLGSSDEAATTRARTSMLRSCTRTAFPFGFRTSHGQRFSGRSKHRINQLGEDWPSQRQWPTATRRIENGTPPARSARTAHAGCPPKAAGKKVIKSLRRCPREGSPLR